MTWSCCPQLQEQERVLQQIHLELQVPVQLELYLHQILQYCVGPLLEVTVRINLFDFFIVIR